MIGLLAACPADNRFARQNDMLRKSDQPVYLVDLQNIDDSAVGLPQMRKLVASLPVGTSVIAFCKHGRNRSRVFVALVLSTRHPEWNVYQIWSAVLACSDVQLPPTQWVLVFLEKYAETRGSSVWHPALGENPFNTPRGARMLKRRRHN